MNKTSARHIFLMSADNQRVIRNNDKPAIRQHWNDFVDYLQKSDRISKRQANTWVNPFLSKKDR